MEVWVGLLEEEEGEWVQRCQLEVGFLTLQVEAGMQAPQRQEAGSETLQEEGRVLQQEKVPLTEVWMM